MTNSPYDYFPFVLVAADLSVSLKFPILFPLTLRHIASAVTTVKTFDFSAIAIGICCISTEPHIIASVHSE